MAPWQIKFEHFLRRITFHSMSTSSWSLHGYDNLKQLLDMQPEEIIDVLKEVALYDKPGHRKIFISANTEYRIKTRQASVLHQC
jgi:hypothetical protein